MCYVRLSHQLYRTRLRNNCFGPLHVIARLFHFPSAAAEAVDSFSELIAHRRVLAAQLTRACVHGHASRCCCGLAAMQQLNATESFCSFSKLFRRLSRTYTVLFCVYRAISRVSKVLYLRRLCVRLKLRLKLLPFVFTSK